MKSILSLQLELEVQQIQQMKHHQLDWIVLNFSTQSILHLIKQQFGEETD